MVAEFYPGWLAHWAEKFPRVDAGTVARQTDKYLKNDVSFNYYMVHGGTNFDLPMVPTTTRIMISSRI